MSKTGKKALWVLAVLSPLALGADWIGPTADGKSSRARDLAAELAAHPLARNENIRPLPLARGEHTSHLLVQIRDREPVHYHADSDISVLMLRGSGTIHIGEQRLPAKAGDVMFIPRGVVHYFINEAKEPAAALVIYSPPPGPNDRVLVPQPAPR
jgi:mannose-6-phosphate isomerase-like protein (cupin superfamily)